MHNQLINQFNQNIKGTGEPFSIASQNKQKTSYTYTEEQIEPSLSYQPLCDLV